MSTTITEPDGQDMTADDADASSVRNPQVTSAVGVPSRAILKKWKAARDEAIFALHTAAPGSV